MKLILEIMDLAVFAALVAFIPSAIYFILRQGKKAKASIALIYRYAKKAQDNLNARIGDYEKMKQLIEKGDPYGEPDKSFTPLFFYTKEDELSFEQIREILPYLKSGKDNEQARLLDYFSAQSSVDAILNEINTNHFHTIPQARKVVVIDLLKKETQTLQYAADKLVEILH